MSDTRGELLEATGRVLARDGYAGLTTQKVADEVGVSHPTVHYHFDTKEGLLVAYVEDYADQWTDELADIDGEDAGDRLATLLSGFVGGLADPEWAGGTLALLELHSRAPHVEPLRDALARLDRRATGFVAGLIETGIEEGVFHDVDPETTAELILCAADGASLRKHTLDGDAAAVIADGLARRVLADVYVGDVPDLGGDGA
jgi:AcrR family transcriptional regulator